MIKIGITGGIGSGKSYVSHLLEEAGIPVYDTDTEAKKLTLSHPRIREGLLVLL
jgi:dephospho-CoA kinase